jgi:NAD+ kinase
MARQKVEKKAAPKAGAKRAKIPPLCRRIGFVIKHRVPAAAALAVDLGLFIARQRPGVALYFAEESEEVARSLIAALKQGGVGRATRIQVVAKNRLPRSCDLILVLGGDGTYLSIARLMRERSIPVLGVNMGQLGFLTETKRSEAFDVVGDLLEGRPPLISERALLEVCLHRESRGKSREIFRGPVVNDAVISKGAIARIIGLEVSLDGRPVSTIRADGVIVSTPTGSTAYSLAAGGPILEPRLQAMTLTPICPHALTQRPLVVSDSAEIAIRLQHRPGPVLLTLDGQDVHELREGDTVTITRFRRHMLKLVASPTRDYFSVLREKLKFGMHD